MVLQVPVELSKTAFELQSWQLLLDVQERHPFGQGIQSLSWRVVATGQTVGGRDSGVSFVVFSASKSWIVRVWKAWKVESLARLIQLSASV